MSEIPTDVPWDVNWDKKFESQVEELKNSGSFDRYRDQIIEIIEYPIREGKYKSENLKGLKTTHISGSDQDIICFELTPGINHQTQKDKLEEVYFHFITHWDNYDSELSGRNPSTRTLEFEIQIPYLEEGFSAESVKSSVYETITEMEDAHVNQSWEEEHIELNGVIPPEKTEVLEDLLPDGVLIEFEDNSLF